MDHKIDTTKVDNKKEHINIVKLIKVRLYIFISLYQNMQYLLS